MMKYKLIIDKNAEEEIIAIVHAPSSLTQQIENLVCSFSGADGIMVEVHNNPSCALCDGDQSLTPAQFGDLMKSIDKVRTAIC